jgi:hypothetical protein
MSTERSEPAISRLSTDNLKADERDNADDERPNALLTLNGTAPVQGNYMVHSKPLTADGRGISKRQNTSACPLKNIQCRPRDVEHPMGVLNLLTTPRLSLNGWDWLLTSATRVSS